MLRLSLGLALLASSVLAGPAFAQTKVGVAAAVNQEMTGTPPTATSRNIVIGTDVFHKERLVTNARGQAQMLFLDGSAFTVGPDSDVSRWSWEIGPGYGGEGVPIRDLLDHLHGPVVRLVEAVCEHELRIPHPFWHPSLEVVANVAEGTIADVREIVLKGVVAVPRPVPIDLLRRDTLPPQGLGTRPERFFPLEDPARPHRRDAEHDEACDDQ